MYVQNGFPALMLKRGIERQDKKVDTQMTLMFKLTRSLKKNM